MSNATLYPLLNCLSDLGFGNSPLLKQQIEEEIVKQSIGFNLYTEAFFDEYTKMEAKLYFWKANHAYTYSLEGYQAFLLDLDDKKKSRSQTFYIQNGLGVTFKESFNLLQGRSVYKNLIDLQEKYAVWIRLDFGEKDENDNYKVKQYGLRYSYELEKVLAKYPIRELHNDTTKAELYRSLKHGNIQSVIFDKPTKSEIVYIEANPMFKTINIFPELVMAAKKICGDPLLSLSDNSGQPQGH